MSDPFTSFSHTHRVVLLIDVSNSDSDSDYFTTLLSSLNTILSFPSLSSSLFSFHLFFSSLSPLLSLSKLPLPSPFDLPLPTLHSLSQSLSQSLSRSVPSQPNKASHIAASLLYIFHHYSWDPPIPNESSSITSSNSFVPSNLVLLFSPLSHSFDSFFEPHSFSDVSLFSGEFSRCFNSVRNVFDSRDIHCSFVRVGSGSGSCHNDEVLKVNELFRIGAAKLGWGFCSLDSIVLGSAIVPFSLIYPKIGTSWGSIQFDDDCSKKVQVKLSLNIFDVNHNPIGYNCCDLELVDFKILARPCQDVWFKPESSNVQGGGCERKERFWKICSDGVMKFEVKAVCRCDAFVNLRECLSDSILVRECFRESKKKHEPSSDDFYGNRVLQMLAAEFGSQWWRKPAPIWEILLSFLCKEGYWAFVSLTNANGDSVMCILRPFTVSSALLSVLGDLDLSSDFGVANMSQYVRAVDAEVHKSGHKLKNDNGLLDSHAMKSSDIAIEGHHRKKVMDMITLKNLTWSSFCDSVYGQFGMDLYEVYYAVGCNKSKKLLKFLKCWMKQVKKSGCYDPTLSEKPKPYQIIAEDINDKLAELPQNGEQPITPSSSVGVNTEASRIQDEAVLDFRLETSEAFFSNLPNKIHQGIESEDIDLVALAARLVSSSIYWLCQKVDKETVSESHSSSKGHNSRGSIVVSELTKLLLREPKELAAKHKGRNSLSQTSDTGAATQVTEHVILFRMEILQSEVGSGVGDSSKQKFVKQICLLFENIQCHMEGGFFGDWNLENYVSRIIKTRYSDTLEDMVHKIYNKMDLLLFADEDEAPNNLLNSEDSNKSLNQIVYRDEMGENDVSYEMVLAENGPIQSEKNDSGRLTMITSEDHNRKLIEAKERRERARRFSSFTSWMPDLHRVWAPKQKSMKLKTDPLRKLQKRKERRRASYDTVYETPMAANKHSSPWSRGSDDDSSGSQICGSISKALFQDDDL
ncbi:hypothetical protein TanjilG_04707 [Lupinus angustifolius]|uniref:Treslin N-terminal domain-containing protein n=1 Tax=Lupinus angustifolius TaxID=3871 RepID=A0A4P1RKR1_LUPAN|nr:hypothetical protein TanjilG_04707 [Lupinus angustifolius]